jgi:hypothetical protein
MKNLLKWTSAVFALAISGGGLQAQPGVGAGVGYGGIGRGPTVSPYVGLGAPNAGLNYLYNIRPQLEIRALMNRQQGEINDIERRSKLSARDQRKKDPLSQEEFTLPRTGHRVYFSTYSHYYTPPAGRGR